MRTTEATNESTNTYTYIFQQEFVKEETLYARLGNAFLSEATMFITTSFKMKKFYQS